MKCSGFRAGRMLSILSGRYVEIKVPPLSFREFLDFHGYSVTERKSPAGGMRKRITDAGGEIYEVRELFDTYVKFSGMPMLADAGLEISKNFDSLTGQTRRMSGLSAYS